MIPTRYNSFDEIDKQLKILNLQREINKESLKLNFIRSKMSLTPANILNEFKVSFQKEVLKVIIEKLLKRYGKSE